MLPRPFFEDSWDAFQKVNIPANQVGRLIGGRVGQNFDIGAFQNACTIRLSYVLNSCGSQIERRPDLSSVSGADGKWYLYRVRDALQYLEFHWGRPDMVAFGPPISLTSLRFKFGVLIFEIPGLSDASGHATLWNGKQCSDQDYFDSAKSCSLWSLPRRFR